MIAIYVSVKIEDELEVYMLVYMKGSNLDMNSSKLSRISDPVQIFAC